MPPVPNRPDISIDPSHMLARSNPYGEGGLPPPKKEGPGPIIGVIVIVILLIFGGLYFWGAQLNEANSPDQLPFIPGTEQ